MPSDTLTLNCQWMTHSNYTFLKTHVQYMAIFIPPPPPNKKNPTTLAEYQDW